MSTFHAYVDAAHFHEALGNVLRFAAKRSRLPILEEAQVRFEDGHCVLTCTNLDQWCMSTIPAVGDSFSFVFVGTRKILSACKYFSGELELTYTIEPTETNPDPRGQISISDGKRSLKRSTERTSDFPELKEKPLDRHYGMRQDPTTGAWRSTYATFKRCLDVSGIWEYCGHCFSGETVERGTPPPNM